MIDLEFQEIIKKNLPAQVGDVLKERLEQADKDVKLIDSLRVANESYVKKIQELNLIVDGYKEFDERNLNLEKREKEVSERERQQEIEKLKYQLESEKNKTEFTKEVALKLVRNTEYRNNIFDSEFKDGYYDHNNNWIPGINTTKSYTEHKTKE